MPLPNPGVPPKNSMHRRSRAAFGSLSSVALRAPYANTPNANPQPSG